MPKLDKNEINKLPPEERLTRLKKIEEESKAELKEAEDLIKKVQLEIKSSRKEIEAPPIENVDISRLFERESSLESVAEEAKKVEPEELKVEYTLSTVSISDQTYKLPEDMPAKKMIESGYSPASEDATKSTASRQTLKSIKMYDKG